MIPPLDRVSGLLPPGRHRCSEAEVEAEFVSCPRFASSPTRKDIWQDWGDVRDLLQNSIKVYAAWLGGSFTSAKLNPEDLDVTFLVSGDDCRKCSPADQRIVSLFSGGSYVKTALRVKLDTYLLPWECVLQPQAGANPVHDAYYWARGQWDDWWQRSRINPKGTPPVPAEAVPRRGYLEVQISDYS